MEARSSKSYRYRNAGMSKKDYPKQKTNVSAFPPCKVTVKHTDEESQFHMSFEMLITPLSPSQNDKQHSSQGGNHPGG